MEELASFLQHWNRTVARVRIHGTTRKQVYGRFLDVEKPALKPLPEDRFSFFEVGTRTVHPDGHVEVARAFYSVPDRLVGEEVRTRWDDRLVRVYYKGECVGVHTRAPAGSFTTGDEHRPVHKPARQAAYETNLLARAERIGPRALDWKGAIEDRGVRAYRLLQGMISLTRKHPKERVDWACGIASGREVFRYRPLRRLVEQAAARAPAPSLLLQSHAVIRNLREYAEEVKV